MECKDSPGRLLSKNFEKHFLNEDAHSVAGGNEFCFTDAKIISVEEGKFNRLSLTERANLVWEKGTFVDSVMYNSYCVMLYSVNHQFIELFMEVKSSNIVWISLANDCDLARYLQDFHIEV